MSKERARRMNNFDRCFMSAEYRSGYDKGYAHGLRAAAVCLLIVGACVLLFCSFVVSVAPLG